MLVSREIQVPFCFGSLYSSKFGGYFFFFFFFLGGGGGGHRPVALPHTINNTSPAQCIIAKTANEHTSKETVRTSTSSFTQFLSSV